MPTQITLTKEQFDRDQSALLAIFEPSPMGNLYNVIYGWLCDDSDGSMFGYWLIDHTCDLTVYLGATYHAAITNGRAIAIDWATL